MSRPAARVGLGGCFYIARRVIGELQRDTSELAYLKAEAAPDFVFVEESVDGELRDSGTEVTPDLHAQACGLVFLWLRREHGVPPPAWWLRWMRGEKEA